RRGTESRRDTAPALDARGLSSCGDRDDTRRIHGDLTMMGTRRPETIKELEALQQREREGAGESALTSEAFLRLAREDIQKELLAAGQDIGNDALVDQTLAARLKEWTVDDPGQWSRFEPPSHRFGIAKSCARLER